MLPKDLELMQTFMAFIKDAQTRSGTTFVFESFQLAQGNEANMKATGKIFIEASNKSPDIPLAMEWDLSGNALMIGKQFDLVCEDSFHDIE
ncbi:hypothetical protein F0919_14455 [Taibaiella lutea]|uniref:Uncharacterized protein n=1 Tax=Taibaiella lutea TaxID=2608001 RepID=A0A5M6CH29_9BACT|nr:hypothetical protein [Taibaiella lutea]KAA5533730.1 hypothetical protein F0919_14455 [Taibaiella lutea]